MNVNVGEQREMMIVEALNNRKIKDLEENLRNMVKFIFPEAKPSDVVKAKLSEGMIKPDFSVTVNEETHYVSMKSGINTIFHQEYIDNFSEFLKEKGMKEHTIKTIRYFQFGDGTFDGSGAERMSYTELRSKLEHHTPLANRDLNKDRKLMVELVNRFVFKGSHEDNIEADFIYEGDINYGQIISRSQVLKHLERKNWDFLESLHIGPILFRPHARYYKKAIKHQSSRLRIEFYWPNLSSDMAYIKSHYLP